MNIITMVGVAGGDAGGPAGGPVAVPHAAAGLLPPAQAGPPRPPAKLRLASATPLAQGGATVVILTDQHLKAKIVLPIRM